MQGREKIRQVEKECNTCEIRKAKAVGQIMAPLSQIRLALPLRAFSRCTVNFGGPFLTKEGIEKKGAKRYLFLFTCLVSLAAHLEIVHGLDTHSFLNVFYRMTNRRGLPVEMLSDNNTTFVGGEREFWELIEQLDAEKIVASGADKESNGTSIHL